VKRAFVALGLVIAACSTRATRVPAPRSPGGVDPGAGRIVRVALVAPDPRVGATRDFTVLDADGRTTVAAGRSGQEWRVERQPRGAHVRAIRSDGESTSWQRGLVLRPGPGGMATVNGKRYRGVIAVLPLDTGLVVVNQLRMEDYLRGVVPLEMGRRPREEAAALEAQAVTARSYAYIRVTADGPRAFDLRSTVADQVYGGADVEHDIANDAIDATRGLVLQYGGAVVDAPYSSTCGGSTAEQPDVWWRRTGEPYLRRVSDRIGDSDRFYCDPSPHFRWTRTMSGSQLDAVLSRYLQQYVAVPAGGPGSARMMAVRERTSAGRVAVLEVETDRGSFPLRGNDIRFVMRDAGSAILLSTYFSVEPELGSDGHVARVTFRGQGNGHGIGMCQWGAIGRARAGQSFRTILGTYYPGTTVGRVQ
jgi:stage II sporulation protein D